MAIIDDLKQVAALFGADRRQPPIVQDEEFHAGEALEEAWVSAVGAGQGEVLKEPGQPDVEG